MTPAELRFRSTPSYGHAGVVGCAVVAAMCWLVTALDALSLMLSHPPAIGTIERALVSTDSLAKVGSGISILVWAHRACANAYDLLRPTGDSPGTVVASFLVPLANVIWPILTIGKIVGASNPDHPGRSTPWVAVWWVAYLVAAAAAGIRKGFGPSVTFQNAVLIEGIRAALLSLSVLGLVFVVRAVTAGQRELFQRLTGQSAV